MYFRLLLGLSALFVASCAAYFSVLGIATLFSGSYYQVMVMAASLELGKLVATSFLYRYWKETITWLKLYLCAAVIVLMVVTSLGIFGYLSAAYQVNSSLISSVDSKVELIAQQKTTMDSEITQINQRIDTLNQSRLAQEKRLPQMSRVSAKPVYEDIQKSSEEIRALNQRVQELQTSKIKKDEEILALKEQTSAVKDIGTFKFVANAINKPLDQTVTIFICILIAVFDPLAVGLVLAFNIATFGTLLRKAPSAVVPKSEEPASSNPSVFTGKLKTR